MSLLRVYDPKGCLCGCGGECDERGFPLDWERCRASEELDGGMGSLHEVYRQNDQICPDCDGHGSLRAAALAWLIENRTVGPWGAHAEAKVHANGTRCEDCGHPMSEGTWEPDGGRRSHLDYALHELRAGREPNTATDRTPARIHYSPCDEGCRHGGPGRIFAEHEGQQDRTTEFVEGRIPTILFRKPEASWRPVDVRTLGWPADLRPEKLAVLCLRCYAARTPAESRERETVTP